MKRLLSRGLAALLILGMLFALAACGEDSGKPSGSGEPGTSQQSEKPSGGDGDDKESFVEKFDHARAYMMPDAGSYQGYTEQKYNDGTLKDFSFDVADITEQEMDAYTAKLEANGYVLTGGGDFGGGKEYENADEGVTILIVYMEIDKDYRITVTK